MLMASIFAQRASYRDEQTSVWKPVRCRLECKRVLRFSEADGREVIASEGRAFLPPDAGVALGGELVHEGESHRIVAIKAHESPLMGYIEVKLS